MDGVITLFAAQAEESQARRRIRRLGLPFEILFLLLTGLTVLGMAAVFVVGLAAGPAALWIGADNTWLVLPGSTPPMDAAPFHSLPPATRLAGGLAFAVIGGSLALAFHWLRALFGAYRRGDVFGPAPQGFMQAAALALIVFALAPGLLQPLLRLVGSPDRGWFHGHSLAALMVGGVLIVLARVMALGREVERETREFI